MSLVSVIIPYYRKINHINETLNSVLNQTYKNFEIILIYDDTDNDDLEIINNNFKDNHKIKIIKNSKNHGAGISRNIGLKNSLGEIIAFLDADDIWLPNRLENQINFMKENNYDFTFCNYKKKISKNSHIKVECKKNKISYQDLIYDCEIGLSTVILNKKVIKDDLFPSLKTKEDYVAWLKITKDNINAYNFSESLVIWNYSKNSLSSSLLQKLLDGFRVYYYYEKFNFLKSFLHLTILGFKSLTRKF